MSEPIITISIHGKEETLTLQEAITLRNKVNQYLSQKKSYVRSSYPSRVRVTIFDSDYSFTKESAISLEVALTAAINKEQTPVAAFLNRLPDNLVDGKPREI